MQSDDLIYFFVLLLKSIRLCSSWMQSRKVLFLHEYFTLKAGFSWSLVKTIPVYCVCSWIQSQQFVMLLWSSSVSNAFKTYALRTSVGRPDVVTTHFRNSILKWSELAIRSFLFIRHSLPNSMALDHPLKLTAARSFQLSGRNLKGIQFKWQCPILVFKQTVGQAFDSSASR
jgi:hypothetical protein